MLITNPLLPAHQLPIFDALRITGADLETGLTSAEAAERLRKYGANRVEARGGTPGWLRLVRQFTAPLVLVLIAASIVTAVLKEWVDAAVILAVVVVNALVGFLQESKAENALEPLMKMVVAEAVVRRDGKKTRVDSTELVPGDIVMLAGGDRVPADIRLLETRSLQIDESSLTGESVPAHKRPDPLSADTVLADRVNMAYGGSLVTAGSATGVVWATGDRTETGRVAFLIAEAVDLTTPLTRKIARFSGILLWVILGLAAVLFAYGVLVRGGSVVEMLMASVALAVGVIPEGLPAAITIVLAIGVGRMAGRRAIIRKLPAVETLGSTTVICSDKTGTLTQNKMTVRRIYAGGETFHVSGTGYEPKGEFRTATGEALDAGARPALHECLRAGMLCNDSGIVEKRRLHRGRRRVHAGDRPEDRGAPRDVCARRDTLGRDPDRGLARAAAAAEPLAVRTAKEIAVRALQQSTPFAREGDRGSGLRVRGREGGAAGVCRETGAAIQG